MSRAFDERASLLAHSKASENPQSERVDARRASRSRLATEGGVLRACTVLLGVALALAYVAFARDFAIVAREGLARGGPLVRARMSSAKERMREASAALGALRRGAY